MVPKLHKKGRSFKGAAAYLLGPARAGGPDRVAWVETQNLPVSDPDLSWRLMAATAMDQGRLKAEAGCSPSGRKSTLSVLHLSLSWHPDEASQVDRDEMLQAAKAALSILGASDRQAMFIAHNDRAQPHVHILANRVSPEDGRMLSSSKEKLNLSKWAEEYERATGRIVCPERVVNNEARKRGEFTRGDKDAPRHIHDLQADARTAAPKDRDGFQTLVTGQREKDRALSRQGHDQAHRHRTQWDHLLASHQTRNAAVHQAEQKAVGRQKAETRSQFRPEWRNLETRHRAELADFEDRETRLVGKIQNAWRAWKDTALPAQIRGEAKDPQTLTSQKFRAISSKGERSQALAKSHAAQRAALERQQREPIARAAEDAKSAREDALRASRAAFAAERMQLILSQRAEEAKLRAQWRSRNQERQAAFARYRQAQELAPPVRAEFAEAALPGSRSRASSGDFVPEAPGRSDPPPRGDSVLPSPASVSPDQAKKDLDRQIEAAKQRKERDRDKDPDRGR